MSVDKTQLLEVWEEIALIIEKEKLPQFDLEKLAAYIEELRNQQ